MLRPGKRRKETLNSLDKFDSLNTEFAIYPSGFYIGPGNAYLG